MQALAPVIPGRALRRRGDQGRPRAGCASWCARGGLTLPVGIDSDGALAALYKVASCPQVDLRLPGRRGAEPGAAATPALAALRARVGELVAARGRADGRGRRA